MKNNRINKILATTMATTILVTPIAPNVHAMEAIKSESTYIVNNLEPDEQSEEWIKSIDDVTGEEFLLNEVTNEKVYDVFETQDGETVKLSIDEALLKFTQSVPINEEPTIQPRIESFFKKTSSKQITGSAKKLTQDVAGGSKGATISVSNSATISETFSISLDATMKKKVRAGAGFSWNTSLSRSVTTTHRVPAKKIGYVAFKPYYNQVTGKLTTMLHSGESTTKTVTANSPKRLSTGVCDGLEYLVTK
ncbi:hypothetical protein [Metaclostridioides mangenotii]|uniref:Uncharacterized protein n=1 Tax=Metaclostridioides mangenotii TaxID=1540 RepID=A0ABS4E6Y7_9FIRM|nr:hypothetical protein [Clostridioides mangenotii]MBP1853702.1 hypothetical protein [Clostridioides mangenotii]